MSSLVETLERECVGSFVYLVQRECIICIAFVFLQCQNICSQRVKSCVQPNTGDLLSQAVNGGRTPRTGRVQG